MKLLIQNGRVLDPVSKTVTLTDLLAENGRVAPTYPIRLAQ